jgi:hypothetical protein
MKHPNVGEVWHLVEVKSGVNKLILINEVVSDESELKDGDEFQFIHVYAYLLDGFEPENIKGKGEYSNIQWTNSYKNYADELGSCYCRFIKRIKEAE